MRSVWWRALDVITVELDAKPTDKNTDWIVEELAHWHAVAHAHPSGHVAATMTLPAEGISQAVATAVRLIEPTHRVVSLEFDDTEQAVADAGAAGVELIAPSTRTRFQSLNACVQGPEGWQVAFFQELEAPESAPHDSASRLTTCGTGEHDPRFTNGRLIVCGGREWTHDV